MNYLNKIENIIEDNIVEVKRYEYHANQNLVETYFNIGKLLVEAQGGETRAKYGNGLIREYSIILKNKYGKEYSYRNMYFMKQLYITFKKVNAVRSQFGNLSWTHYRTILPIKNINKRNYYINLSIKNRLSYRELMIEIKNNSFERLSYADKNNIKIISDSNESVNIVDMIRDPILISIGKNYDKKLSEKVLRKCILGNIEKFLLELGCGFCFAGSEQKIKLDNNYHYVDLMFFNYELNCFVLIELKIEKLNIRDIGQLEFYVNYYDSNIRKPFHNQTIGIIVCDKKDKNIEKIFNKDNIKITTYKMK